ncbi:MAG: hypothetical protein OXH39_16025 [Candidatus Poribacteria bacterium]|nr:hypothetical protein [Candidatus Poribacteria bacterium]
MKRQDILISFCLIFGLLCPVSAKSLSSEKIVFSSNRDGNWEIYLMNPDGTRQERLTYDRAVDCEPVISPTGDRILFTSNRRGTRDLYLMDVDGRNVRPLFGVSELVLAGAAAGFSIRIASKHIVGQDENPKLVLKTAHFYNNASANSVKSRTVTSG